MRWTWAATVTALLVVGLQGGTSAAALGSSTITGFGANVKAWNSTHAEDHRGNVVPGCCFDPMPVPGLRYGDRYYAVKPMSGVVMSYEMHLTPMPVSQARATAMKELPSDARPVSFTVHGKSCAILIASSPRLEATLAQNNALVSSVRKINSILGEAVSASRLKTQLGEVVIEFSSGAAGQTYNPSAVNDLLFSSLAVAGSTAQNC